MWGKSCCHRHVLVYCDNMSVVQIMASKTSKGQGIMHLLRCLHFFTGIFNINLKVMHLAGKLNVVADSISHNIFPMQSIQLSQQPMPDPIPSPLWQLLVTEQPDWTYVNWRELLRTSAKQSLNINSQRAYHAAQKQYIEFCQSFQIVPLPATEQVLILFVADLSSRVCHVTAWSYLSAVRHLHISNGYGDPLKGALQLELKLQL